MELKNHVVITISRTNGSGGREIGQKLAEYLGIPYYDKELISMAAKASGFSEKIFEESDQQPTNSLLYALSLYGGAGMSSTGAMFDLPLNDKVYLAQSDVIRKVADQGPCVIVGRCADYVLKDRVKCVNIFIHADLDTRIARVEETYKNEKDGVKTADRIQKNDKRRGTYYSYYTGKKWGRAENYDLCINSALAGVDKTAELLRDFILSTQ